MNQKVIKSGNSLAVTIPSKFAKSVGITISSPVEVETRLETGQLILTFPGMHQLSLTSQFQKSQKKQ